MRWLEVAVAVALAVGWSAADGRRAHAQKTAQGRGGPAERSADPDAPGYGATAQASAAEAGDAPEASDEEYEATARLRRSPITEAEQSLGRSRVTRTQIEERQPRSAPDALRYEPGVSVQKTAHGQASPYVRGMTGQQIVFEFDDVRMNNGIYRQGPNQYFFTVDSRTVDHIDVIRGSASTRYGSAALGGAIVAYPIEPYLDPANEGVTLRPRLMLRYRTADREKAADLDGLRYLPAPRLQLEAAIEDHTAVLIGGGHRHVGLLRAGGVVDHLEPLASGEDAVMRSDVVPWVPRFREEQDHPSLTERHRWRTQRGTGFREGTFDGRVLHRVSDGLRAVGAVYGYRQHDAPRTDKCPPPEAPVSECLDIDEQFRTLAYVGLRGDAGPLRDLRLTLSYQRHHERRVHDRPRSRVQRVATDDVDTFGIGFRAATPAFALGEQVRWKLRYGFDGYTDAVSSVRFQSFTDVGHTQKLSRGQYLDGSRYVRGGMFAELEVTPLPWLTLRSGGRGAVVGVRAPPDPESGSRAISREMGAVVGRAGVEVRPSEQLALLFNFDQGFRAPNLDDLTSRQQVGPGFQFENADLRPERTTTYELGAVSDVGWLRLEGWAYVTMLDDAIMRIVRESSDCPPSTPQCGASRNQFQLINFDERSRIFGAEGGATVYLPLGFTLRKTLSYAWGDGPNPGGRITDPELLKRRRVPLSRIPPINGTFEGRWRHVETGLWSAVAVRWAGPQRRLALSDVSDPRVPVGGTPGYGVVDLRLGWRHGKRLAVTLILENLLDAPYRVHGSSVNGPGRGVIVAAEGGL